MGMGICGGAPSSFLVSQRASGGRPRPPRLSSAEEGAAQAPPREPLLRRASTAAQRWRQGARKSQWCGKRCAAAMPRQAEAIDGEQNRTKAPQLRASGA